jgi:hypothetical protein
MFYYPHAEKRKRQLIFPGRFWWLRTGFWFAALLPLHDNSMSGN